MHYILIWNRTCFLTWPSHWIRQRRKLTPNSTTIVMTSLLQWTFYSSVAIFQLHQRMEFTFDISYVNSKLCLLTAFSRWHKSYPNNVTLVVMTNWLIATKYSFFRWQWIMSFYQHYVFLLSTTKPLSALTVAFFVCFVFLVFDLCLVQDVCSVSGMSNIDIDHYILYNVFSSL